MVGVTVLIKMPRSKAARDINANVMAAIIHSRAFQGCLCKGLLNVVRIYLKCVGFRGVSRLT